MSYLKEKNTEERMDNGDCPKAGNLLHFVGTLKGSHTAGNANLFGASNLTGFTAECETLPQGYKGPQCSGLQEGRPKARIFDQDNAPPACQEEG